MRVFNKILELLSEQTIEQMKNDDRMQFYKGAIWVLESDVQAVQEQYQIKLHEGTRDLFFKITGGRNMLDLDLMFTSDMNLMEEEKELFYYNFNKWLKIAEQVITDNAKYLAENYKESERNYYDLLKHLAEKLNEDCLNNNAKNSEQLDYIDSELAPIYEKIAKLFNKEKIVAFNYVRQLYWLYFEKGQKNELKEFLLNIIEDKKNNPNKLLDAYFPTN